MRTNIGSLASAAADLVVPSQPSDQRSYGTLRVVELLCQFVTGERGFRRRRAVRFSENNHGAWRCSLTIIGLRRRARRFVGCVCTEIPFLLNQPLLYTKDRRTDGLVVLAFSRQHAAKLDEPSLLEKDVDQTVDTNVENRIDRDVVVC